MAHLENRGLRPPQGFTRHEHVINGVKTVVHVGGHGPPVVYWHGAGSWHGFDFAQAWLDRFQIIVPAHPGWGDSADAPQLDSVNDYLLHYLDLFDERGLVRFDLIGFSLGGWLAAEFAVAHGHRLRKLVLVAPAGLMDAENPGPPGLGTWSLEQMYSYLVGDLETLRPYLPKTPAEATLHAAQVSREMQSTGRLLAGRGPFNPNLERWLHRATMPTLLVWSKADRLAPAGRHARWMKQLPNAQLTLVDKGGHLVLDESDEARNAVAKFLA